MLRELVLDLLCEVLREVLRENANYSRSRLLAHVTPLELHPRLGVRTPWNCVASCLQSKRVHPTVGGKVGPMGTRVSVRSA